MRITNLKITNFKNFLGENEFDFSKNIILLYGANGYGKSTVFEAIEWCLTSQIEKYSNSDYDFRFDVANKTLIGKESFLVEVVLSFEEFKITKSFSMYEDSSNTNISSKLITKNGQKINGVENIEVYLKNILQEDYSYSKGFYNQLLKKSYILSQDQISNFVKSNDDAARYKALVDIMGLKSILLQFENFKNLINKLKKKNEELSNIKNEINYEIYTNKNFIQKFDENKFTEIIDQIKTFKEIEKLEEKEIDSYIRDALEIKNYHNRFNNVYSDLSPNLSIISFSEIGESIKLLKKESQVIKEKIDRSDKLKKRLIIREKEIKNFKNNIIEIQNTYEKISEIKKKLKSLNVKDSNTNNNEMNIKLEKAENDIFILKFILQFKDFISSKSPENLYKKNERERLIKKISINEKKIFKRNELIDSLKITGENEKDILFNRLINGIEEIHNYIVKNSTNKCPVCNSLKEDLQSDVEISLNDKINYLKRSNQKYEKISKVRNNITKSITRLIDLNSAIKDEIRSLDKSIKGYETQLNYYTNSKYYDAEHSQKSYNAINEEIKTISLEIDKIKKAQKNLLEIERLNKVLKSFNSSKNKDYAEEIEKITKSNSLNENRKTRLIEFTNDLVNKIKNIYEQNETLEKHYNKLEFIDDNQKSISLNQIYDSSFDKIKVIEQTIAALNSLKTMITIKEINNNTNEVLTKLYERKKENDKQISYYAQSIYQLNQYKENTELTLGESVLDYLNKDTFSIKRYFNFLNPLPGEGELVFKGGTNEVSIHLGFNKELSNEDGGLSNVANIMSSGQLNVLALSIFLAMNQEQKIHPFDFIGIDDPIQNMDDVNQFTICDVLGQLNKQLIFSTHDKNFLKLFINKNKGSDIIVYSLNSPYMDNTKIEKIEF